jgi:hypothetical protein
MNKPRKIKGAWRTSKSKEQGVTRKEFHGLVKKASQPIKREAQSDSEKSETWVFCLCHDN